MENNSIESAWKHFYTEALGGDCSPDDEQTLKMAFYAGSQRTFLRFQAAAKEGPFAVFLLMQENMAEFAEYQQRMKDGFTD